MDPGSPTCMYTMNMTPELARGDDLIVDEARIALGAENMTI